MKILITGSNGLLGQKLVYNLAGKSDIELIATSKGSNRIKLTKGYRYVPMDITNEEEVVSIIRSERPECIIHTAAMTNVDACEKDQAGCDLLNVDAVRFLLEAATPFGTHFIHLSTDFVFDGMNGPYSETDTPNPSGYYALSKLKSEQHVMESGLPWAIVRTIIIYGVVDDLQRSNLVLWTKSSLEKGSTINVITDQFRSPTLAEDLAQACITIALQKETGIFHICGPEEDLDSIINLAYVIADYFKLDRTLIHPVTTAELNQPAKRPPKTGFILTKARTRLGYKPHSLVEGLKIVEQQLEHKKN
ncbi:MAG TPA: NAD(P)-dependent oxidoreductase [Bacteroidia bacterium]|nr:NAD(P)-dependent oxidoreductase [Bacteroidia bacterium]